MSGTPSRRYPRISAQHVVRVRAQGGRPLEELFHTRTLGCGGCMFVSEEPLGAGMSLDLAIGLHGRVVRAASRVIYEHEQGRDAHEVGVEFLALSSADRRFLEGLVADRREG